MAKTVLIIAVIAFCALVTEGQFSFYPPFFTPPPPTRHPKASTGPYFFSTRRPSPTNEHLGNLTVCASDDCATFVISDHGCHNIPHIDGKWNDKAQGVYSFGQCVHLFEHIGCQGQRISLGPGCSSDDCCHHPHVLSDCNFDNKMTSYMVC